MKLLFNRRKFIKIPSPHQKNIIGNYESNENKTLWRRMASLWLSEQNLQHTNNTV